MEVWHHFNWIYCRLNKGNAFWGLQMVIQAKIKNILFTLMEMYHCLYQLSLFYIILKA